MKNNDKVTVSYKTEEYDIYINSYTPKEIATYKRMIGCNRPFISTSNSNYGLIVKDSKTQIGKATQNWALVFGAFNIPKTNPTRVAIEKALSVIGKQPQKQPSTKADVTTEKIVDAVLQQLELKLNASK